MKENIFNFLKYTKHTILKLKIFKKRQGVMVQKKDRLPIFISKEREIMVGHKAIPKLKKTNDLKYLKNKRGIISVDKQRWLQAQFYEEKTWLRDIRWVKEDRNSFHKKNFDDYFHFQGRKFSNAIEFGCGPFTNIRHIAETADIKNIYLLDPLVKKYLNHPNCWYKDEKIKIKRKGLFRKKLPVTIYNCAIEDFLSPVKFDLIVMINVLEHCYNADKIFDRILEISRKGTYFVFHDKCYDIKDIRKRIQKEYDAGHPLKVEKNVILEFLNKNFFSLLNKTVYFEREKWGMDRSYRGLYYIGKKL